MYKHFLRNRIAAALTVMAIAAGASHAGESPLPALAIGADFPDFTLKDTKNEAHSLAQYTDKIVVFNFSTPECPCSRSVEAPLNELAAIYADQGVVFLGVNSNFFIDSETLEDYIKIAKVPYRILKDDDCKLADATGARVTPEIFVKDRQGKLVFHGPPDNRPSPTGTPTVFYLKDALEALVAEKPVVTPSVTPWGCSIRGNEPDEGTPEHAAEPKIDAPIER